jgi:predicted alpha/beta-fold hydrolase
VATALATGRGIPILAIGLALGGVLTTFFGLTADQISQLRLAAYDQPVYRIVQRPTSEQQARQRDLC